MHTAAPHTASTPDGLYIGRPLVNREALRRWAERYGIDLVAEPHVTVVYSRTSVSLPPDRPTIIVPPSDFRGIGPLGDKGAIVLFLDVPALEQRYAQAQAAGATSDYGGTYRAHLTLTYNPNAITFDGEPRLIDWSTVKPPSFSLVLGPEAAGPVTSNVFAFLFGSAYDYVELMKAAPRAPRAAAKNEDDGQDDAVVDAAARSAVAKLAPEVVGKARANLEQRTPHTIEALRKGVARGDIAKSADELRLVSGWALVTSDAARRPLVDRQGQVATLKMIAKAARDFFQGDRKLGTLHLRDGSGPTEKPIVFGQVVEGLVVTPVVKALLDLPADTPHGLAMTARVSSDVVWKAVKDGRLAMFSIYGKGSLTPVKVRNPVLPTS